MTLKTLKPILWILTLVLVAAAFWWALREQPQPVDLGAVSRGPLVLTVEEAGRTRVTELYTVTSPIAGRLERLAIEEGDSVTAGQTVIASIRPLESPFLDERTRKERLAALEAARAEVALARVDHRRALTARALARSELTRTRELADRQLVSASTLERAESELALQTALVQSAEAGIRVSEARLASAQAALAQPADADPGPGDGDCCRRVVAPADGRVLRVLVRSAQPVAAGAHLVELGDPGNLEVVVELLSPDAARVRAGATASITEWGGGETIEGRVLRVEPAGFTKISALGIEEQRVPVVIALESIPESLGHGFHALARIVVERHADVLRVPISALFRQGEQWAVFTVANGAARLRTVNLGAINDHHAEVRDGLSADDRVVLYPSDLIGEGTAVTER